MSALTDYQKKHCLNNLDYEDWKICSKCPNVKVVQGLVGGHSKCTLEATVPKVLMIIGRDKKEIVNAMLEIEDKMKHGYQRGKIGEVFWNMDEKVPSYFTYDYDANTDKQKKK